MQITDVAGKRVTLMGLGRFGGQIAAARFLAGQGAQVLITDASPADKLAASMEQLKGIPITYRLGEHLTTDFTTADFVVPSPAVPPGNEYLTAARAAGVPVVTEIELTLERLLANPPAKIVAVTGTKGKSTTSAILGRMLSAVNRTHVGGNIGNPLLNQLSAIAPSDWVLLELSSYMLHYLGARGFRPDVAVVTLVSADHLDWHGGVDPYVEAKINLVRHQQAGDHAVIYGGNATLSRFKAATKATVHTYDVQSSAEVPLLIPGRHNQLNAQGALMAAELLGVPRATAVQAVADFPGLPHRLELVHVSGKVRYYNDSIATIPDAAVAALGAFPPGKVIQIVGGTDKHLDMSPLTSALKENAKAVLCIGTLGPALAAAVGQRAVVSGTLEQAVKEARAMAVEGDVVLLSPGCASYDQFPNFEARGDLFRSLARAG